MKNNDKQTSVITLGEKYSNLEKLRNIQKTELFTVPYFRGIPREGCNINKIIEDFTSRGITEVSVRSSSDTEDTKDNSGAGAFKTILNVPINDIGKAIQDIQNHSYNKFGYKIPLIIQEMVQEIEKSGVAFSIDPDTGKNYSVLNYHDGVGEELVSGNVTGKTFKVFNGANSEYIDNDLHKAIFQALMYIKDTLQIGEIDIEYSYSGGLLSLLQVRPITKINGEVGNTSTLMDRYVNYVNHILSSSNNIYGNMIDVNPEELVGDDGVLSQSFFDEIFTNTSLLEAREDLGYRKGENFLTFILDKPYVDLEKNIETFLPDTLSDDECQVFIEYYKTLIDKEPSLQNQLDSVLYPNSLEKIIEILESSEVPLKTQASIIEKFEIFFENLEGKFERYTSEYEDIEKNIVRKLGDYHEAGLLSSVLDTKESADFSGSIDELMEIIKESTYYFTIYARIFFYYSSNEEKESEDFYKRFIYSNSINEYLYDLELLGVDYYFAKGFDFTNHVKQTKKRSAQSERYRQRDEDYALGNPIDIAKIARENLKFMFMSFFRTLGKKIEGELRIRGRELGDMRDIPFTVLMDYLNSEVSESELNTHIEKGKKRKEISKLIDYPGVLSAKHSFVERQMFQKEGFFAGTGSVSGEICVINDIKEFESIDYQNKIIVIKNATPEIDVYLHQITGIITKNGGPLAHIMIRARELDIPAVVGSSHYDELIYINGKQINIDFESKNIASVDIS